jgi:hypothetical protein
MSGISFRSIEYAATPVHLGTSKNGPHGYNEILVEPSSVTPRITDPLLPVSKGGKFYAKLYEIDDGGAASAARGPRYFGVGFRFGITDISTVNIFFHPNPTHARMPDSAYVGLTGSWSGIYRYIQYFGVQLAAAASNMVLVMPVFSGATWDNQGIFRTGWRQIVNSLLVEVQKVAWPDKPGETMVRNQTALKDVILSDFSGGASVTKNFRTAPGLGNFLREIWDFDRSGANAPPGAPKDGKALVYDQATNPQQYNFFHVPAPRWAKFPFFTRDFDPHGHIPERLFYHATTISAYGH